MNHKKPWMIVSSIILCLSFLIAITAFGAPPKLPDAPEPAVTEEKQTKTKPITENKTNVRLLTKQEQLSETESEAVLPDAKENWELQQKILQSAGKEETEIKPDLIYGEQGKPGERGATGEQGERGPSGSTGQTGENGERGPAGERGSAGATGLQGIQGIQGISGKSAYEMAVAGGYAGTEEEYIAFFSSAPDKMKQLNIQMSEVFQSVSSGKTKLASTLTDKGIVTASDASFEEINANVASLYAKAYQDAVAGMNVVYEYHHHEGTAEAGGGCFTEPIYHKHSSECYSERHGTFIKEKWNTHHTTGMGGDDRDYRHDVYGIKCNTCGYVKQSPSFDADTRYLGIVSHNEGAHNCGIGLTCTVAPGTFEGYAPTCGYTEGQIISATINY